MYFMQESVISPSKILVSMHCLTTPQERGGIVSLLVLIFTHKRKATIEVVQDYLLRISAEPKALSSIAHKNQRTANSSEQTANKTGLSKLFLSTTSFASKSTLDAFYTKSNTER